MVSQCWDGGALWDKCQGNNFLPVLLEQMAPRLSLKMKALQSYTLIAQVEVMLISEMPLICLSNCPNAKYLAVFIAHIFSNHVLLCANFAGNYFQMNLQTFHVCFLFLIFIIDGKQQYLFQSEYSVTWNFFCQIHYSATFKFSLTQNVKTRGKCRQLFCHSFMYMTSRSTANRVLVPKCNFTKLCFAISFFYQNFGLLRSDQNHPSSSAYSSLGLLEPTSPKHFKLLP